MTFEEYKQCIKNIQRKYSEKMKREIARATEEFYRVHVDRCIREWPRNERGHPSLAAYARKHGIGLARLQDMVYAEMRRRKLKWEEVPKANLRDRIMENWS